MEVTYPDLSPDVYTSVSKWPVESSPTFSPRATCCRTSVALLLCWISSIWASISAERRDPRHATQRYTSHTHTAATVESCCTLSNDRASPAPKTGTGGNHHTVQPSLLTLVCGSQSHSDILRRNGKRPFDVVLVVTKEALFRVIHHACVSERGGARSNAREVQITIPARVDRLERTYAHHVHTNKLHMTPN